MPGTLDYGKYNPNSKWRGDALDDIQKYRKELERISSRSPREKEISRKQMISRLINGIRKYYDSYYTVGSQIGKKITQLVPTKIDDALFNFAGEASRVRNDLYNQLFDYVINKVNGEMQLSITRKEYNNGKQQEQQEIPEGEEP